MVLCASLYTVQSTLETVQGMCMGEYAAATGGGNNNCAPATAAAAAAATAGVTKTTDTATTAAMSSSSSHSPPPQLSSKNRINSSNNEASSRWSTGTQTARTFPSDRFMEYLPDNPFFTNNSLYDDDNDNNDDDDDDDEEEHNLFKAETAAFFRSCAGGDCLSMPATDAAAAAEHRKCSANMLFSVDTEDGSSLRTPWTRRQQQAAGPGAGGAGTAAAAAVPARQEPRYLQKPLAEASQDDDGVVPNRQQSPKKDPYVDPGDEVDHNHKHHSHHSTNSGTRSKRKKRPAYIVLYRPRTPWPLERLDVVWSYQRVLVDESSSSLPSPTSLQSSRRGGGLGRLTPQPCTTTSSNIDTNMDQWTGLLQDEERVEIGRITGYSIHSSQLLDQLVNSTSGSSSSNHHRHYHHHHQHAVVADPTVVHFAKTILNTTGASAAAATETTTTTTTTTTEGGTSSSSSPTRRPDMGPIFLITNVYVCPEYRGTGLGLFLVDVACRRVADPLALVVLSCRNSITSSSNDVPNHHNDTRQETAASNNVQGESESLKREVVQVYFGLLGFAPISEQFLARRNGRHCPRVEEVCPHMPRNAVSDATTAMATEAVAYEETTTTLQRQQTPPPRRRQLPLSLPPPS